jgi:hypothetical protein
MKTSQIIYDKMKVYLGELGNDPEHEWYVNDYYELDEKIVVESTCTYPWLKRGWMGSLKYVILDTYVIATNEKIEGETMMQTYPDVLLVSVTPNYHGRDSAMSWTYTFSR